MSEKYLQIQNEAYQCLISGLYKKADNYYRQCIEIKPDEKINYWYLGLTLFLQNREEESEELWFELILETSLSENNQNVEELTDLMVKVAQYYLKFCNLKPAEKIYTYLLEQNPDSLDYKYYLATILLNQGKLDKSIPLYQDIIRQEPTNLQSHLCIGQCFYNKGQYWLAYQHFYLCILLKDDDLLSKKLLVMTLRNISFTQIPPKLLKIIESCFQYPDISHQNLMKPCLSILKLDPLFANILQLAQEQNYDQLELEYQRDNFINIINNKIFNELLRKALFNYIDIEILLTNLRRWFCLNVKNLELNSLNFIVSLAIQAFHNEYIWNVTDTEKEKFSFLKNDLENILDNSEDLVISESWQIKLAIFCMYSPLNSINNYEQLLTIKEENLNENILLLIEKEIKDYQEEEEIKTKITSLTNIEDTLLLR